MILSRRYNIDPRGVNTAVTEYIGKLGDVFFQLIERPCKQMAQIMYLITKENRVFTTQVRYEYSIWMG